MQDTAGTWLMTALTTSPLLIALMQTAASLPVLFLGLPAGATADMFDRRRLLIFWQAWMLATVALLSVLTMFGVISPAVLLVLTFLLNIGSAMNNPAWQAIVPELVPRAELPDAIALNSAAFNLARAVGPGAGRPGGGRFRFAPGGRGRGLSAQFRLVPGGDLRSLRLEADAAVQERAADRADLRFHAERRALRPPLAAVASRSCCARFCLPVSPARFGRCWR